MLCYFELQPEALPAPVQKSGDVFVVTAIRFGKEVHPRAFLDRGPANDYYAELQGLGYAPVVKVYRLHGDAR